MRFDGSAVEVGSGVPLESLLDAAGEKGLGGIEFLSGIPGTVGGALKMNAGAWGEEIGQRVEAIEIIDSGGRVRHLDRSEVSFHYRGTRGMEGCVTLCVRLRLDKTDPQSSYEERQRLKTLRRERLPLDLPSCGSVFKRFQGTEPPGRLIEQAGCKGLCRGAAEVSGKHANFIVNHGGATAEDVLWLIHEVRRRVVDRFGLELDLEVELVGEFATPVQ
jgi:UDP-N-acetylmuramate dehydrogenase